MNIELVSKKTFRNAEVFPANFTTTGMNGYRWNGNQPKFVRVMDGDTIHVANSGWYHIKKTNDEVLCYDITDGMIGVSIHGGSNTTIHEIRQRIIKAVARLNLYSSTPILDDRLEITITPPVTSNLLAEK